MERNFN